MQGCEVQTEDECIVRGGVSDKGDEMRGECFIWVGKKKVEKG